jgi:transaldolase
MTTLERLAELGQSVWIDYIRRRMLEDGELARLIAQGVRGLTSNPTIFEQAIGESDDYDAAIRADADPTDARALFDRLAREDVTRAADLFRPLYDRTDGLDGYVSIEVAPGLARDAAGTVAEARRLWRALDRPNVMIKVPGTVEGLLAIRTLIADGVNVNVTLIFSRERYRAVLEAWAAGLEDRLAAGRPVGRVASVASFFVSRVDTLVDRRLEALAAARPDRAAALLALRGRAAVANAKLAYRVFAETLATPRVRALLARGARPQRPLWASTSTKNSAYPDLLYVEPLIGPHTVNTVPPKTLAALLDHGRVARTVDSGWDDAEAVLATLEAEGIDLAEVTAQLEAEGVAAFARSEETLLERLRAKVSALGGRG